MDGWEGIELPSWRCDATMAGLLGKLLLAAPSNEIAAVSSMSLSGFVSSLPAGILLRVKLVEVLLSGLESSSDCPQFPVEWEA